MDIEPAPRHDDPSSPPAHVAIIMDGNGRWARERHMPRIAGHKQGAETLRGIIIAAGELGIAEDRYATVSVDLSEPDSARQAAAAVMNRFGRVDMLIHLVGGWAGGTPVLDVQHEEVSDMLRQHVWTTLHAVQAFVPHMVEQDWGRIVAVSQPAALQPAGNASPYAIGKAGQEVLLLSPLPRSCGIRG